MYGGDSTFLLRTLGHPELTGPGGASVAGLRRKDLALLAYLCVKGRMQPRGWLAGLLWGESPEPKALHSVTQALGRIQRATDERGLVIERETARSTGVVTCDVTLMLKLDGGFSDDLPSYRGPFLEGFAAGCGSERFDGWAEGLRAQLRADALRWLEARGERAEAAGDWIFALRVGERAVQIDPVWEQARRRVLRALLATGERNQALRYYEEYRRWLAAEVGAEPDPETTALVECIRSIGAPPRIDVRSLQSSRCPFARMMASAFAAPPVDDARFEAVAIPPATVSPAERDPPPPLDAASVLREAIRAIGAWACSALRRGAGLRAR